MEGIVTNQNAEKTTKKSRLGKFIASVIGEIIWSIIVVIGGCFFVIGGNKEATVTIGILPFVIIAVIFTFIGCFIGNLLRKFVMPTFVFGSGFFDLLNKKIFWLIIPQIVGSVIGFCLALKLFGGMIGFNAFSRLW